MRSRALRSRMRGCGSGERAGEPEPPPRPCCSTPDPRRCATPREPSASTQVPDSFFGATVALSVSAPGHADAAGGALHPRRRPRGANRGAALARGIDPRARRRRARAAGRGRERRGRLLVLAAWRRRPTPAPDRAPCLSGPDGEYRLDDLAAHAAWRPGPGQAADRPACVGDAGLGPRDGRRGRLVRPTWSCSVAPAAIVARRGRRRTAHRRRARRGRGSGSDGRGPRAATAASS